MSERLEPAPGVRLYYLEDTGVLFCEARQELHLLNTTATLIFGLVEEEGDEAAIASALAAIAGIDAEQSRAHVRLALAEWRERGFIGAAPQVPHTEPESRATDARSPAIEAHLASRRYRLLSSRVLVRFSDEAQVSVVDPVLAHLHDDDESAAITSTIDVVRSDAAIAVYHDGERLATCDALDELAPIVKSTVWGTVLRDEAYFLDIHAGVVSDGERCLLLPAAPGSGKSTLTAVLVHAGYEFFSDEVALLEDRSLGVLPVPLALCVKDTGIDALASRYPRLRELPVHRRGDGKRVVYLPPTPGRRPADARARPVSGLVFPRYECGAVTSLLPLARPLALQALLSQCLRVAMRLDGDRVERIVEWIARLPCYTLRFGDSESALAAIARVFPLHEVHKLSRTAGP